MNLLAQETSPYLLQHAANPVHWRPWGAAALAAAAVEGKPILLSIGYAACHWCHVMAHESFEDPDTAAQMNARYICIKVDREERPDIDFLYMSALQALGEHGGWPLTMFLTPSGAPFWGGTYFPPEPRWGKPSFRQVLQGVADAYHAQDEAVERNSAALTRALVDLSAPRPGGPIDMDWLDRARAALLRGTDPEQGGMRGAPKFPNAPIFRFLWQEAFRTGDPAGQNALHLLLHRMSDGGIYDHLGGGYARYSTDAVWLAPHFEKMLYDNAQILELLTLAHAARPTPLYAERAAETVGWLLRDMAAGPAFAASEDADSEGEEGRFYVWSEAEIDRLLGAASPAFKAAYDVTLPGNWEGKTILRRVTPRGSDADEAALGGARAILLDQRGTRVRPGRDDKVLADWNGLLIAALARAAAVFARPDWLAHAGSAFDFIHGLADAEGRMPHAWRLGRVTAAGLLDDQAAMARAALALFEATGNPARLAQATRLVETARTWFGDAAGAFYTTASDAADVPLGPDARPRTAADHAAPSGNGIMAEVLARLFHLTGDPVWADRAEALIRAFSGAPDALGACPTLLGAADLLRRGASVVITGVAPEPLIAAAVGCPDPAVCVLRAPGTVALPATHPAHGRVGGDVAHAYVCRLQTCSPPVETPAALARILWSGQLE